MTSSERKVTFAYALLQTAFDTLNHALKVLDSRDEEQLRLARSVSRVCTDAENVKDMAWAVVARLTKYDAEENEHEEPKH